MVLGIVSAGVALVAVGCAIYDHYSAQEEINKIDTPIDTAKPVDQIGKVVDEVSS